MLGVLIACSGLVAAGPPQDGVPAADEWPTYRAAAARAGRDAEAQVRLALWCEARGLVAERLNHLALALVADPAHAAARGLLGLMADAGKWRRPEQVAERINGDPAL